MATRLENLTAARDSVAAQLASMAAAGVVPDYSKSGQSVQETAQFIQLLRELESLDQAIARAQGPVSIRSRGRF